jgi:hypothetical protein
MPDDADPPFSNEHVLAAHAMIESCGYDPGRPETRYCLRHAIAALLAARDRLRAALRPFADLAGNPHVQGLRQDGVMPVTVRSLRAAKSIYDAAAERRCRN